MDRQQKYQAKHRAAGKKHLGVVPTTARNRLMRDLLWHNLPKPALCWRCNLPMSRDTFSIEHKVPWLHAENAAELYFDLDNVTYSHQTCNSAASRKTKDD